MGTRTDFVRALLPDGTQTLDLSAFPQFVSPEKS
jgi:hypothetical protein